MEGEKRGDGMTREELRFAEALTEEQSWEYDGVTVLRASVALPQLEGKSGPARRFCRYYRRFCKAYLAYCRQVLLPEAAESLRAALAASAPWEAAEAALRWRVSLREGDVLSIVCDAGERVSGQRPFCIRRSEVWDLSMGLPIPAQEFFPLRRRCKTALLRFAREEALRRTEAGAVYRENWRSMLRRALDTRNYYLTEEGLCFYYPLCALAAEKEGIVSFTMPYDSERGPFRPGAPEATRSAPQCSERIPE